MSFRRFFFAALIALAAGFAFAAVACSGGGTAQPPPADAGRDGRDLDARDAAAADRGASEPGPPSLIELSVTAPGADGGPPASMVPAFSPTIFDYTVRCPLAESTLTVSMTAAPGSSSVLFAPSTAPGRPKQTLKVSVTQNEAIVAAATNDRGTVEYWVRCLPADFPAILWSSYDDAGVRTPGYYLVGDILALQSGGYAMILDSNGVPVWYAPAPKGFGAADVETLTPGNVSFVPFAPLATQPFQVITLSPANNATVAPNGIAPDNHELRVLPSGHYLAFYAPFKTGVDLTGLSVPLPDGGTGKPGPGSIIQDCAIVEFTPAGRVVRTWNASAHFDPATASTYPLLAGDLPPDGGVAYDVFHCNSIDVDPSTGDLLVSARHMDSIFYVAWPGGTVLWKMGGSPTSIDPATYVAVKDRFLRQHDARLQPGWAQGCRGGSGKISLYDDESFAPAPARAVLYDVVVGGADAGTSGCDGGVLDGGTAPGTARPVWEYVGVAASDGLGSFRILPDGSHVIGWGVGGKFVEGTAISLAFTEVDERGDRLLEAAFADGDFTYRAVKVPLRAFDLNTLRAAVASP